MEDLFCHQKTGNLICRSNLFGEWGQLFTVCKYVCRNAVCIEIIRISGDDGSDDCWKEYVVLIICMGVIAPLAEEIVFRWLIYLRLRDYVRMGAAMVISGLIFGIYHGNLVQAVYAGILGMIFAYFLEISGCLWGSVLLHMGANIWSLVSPDLVSWMLQKNPMYILIMLFALILILVYGIPIFRQGQDGQRVCKCLYKKLNFCFEIKMNRNLQKKSFQVKRNLGAFCFT